MSLLYIISSFAGGGSSVNTTYYNTQQSYTASCPSGTTGANVTVTKPAGTFSSKVSQAEANQRALTAATTEANAMLICVAVVSPNAYSIDFYTNTYDI